MIRPLLLSSLCSLLALSISACATATADGSATHASGPSVPSPPPDGEGATLEGVISRDSSGAYRLDDTNGKSWAITDANSGAPRVSSNVGRRARVTLWWAGKGDDKAKVGTATTVQVMDGPEVDAVRAAVARFACDDARLQASDRVYLEDRHDTRAPRFRAVAQMADNRLLQFWLDRDTQDPSRLTVSSAHVAQGKMLAPLCQR